jgi:hypothetical protein
MFHTYDMSRAYQEQLLRDARSSTPPIPWLLVRVRSLLKLLRIKSEAPRPKVRVDERYRSPSPSGIL